MRMLSELKTNKLHDGTVIPAHPLALHSDRTLDRARQKRLTQYYLNAGAGGIAVAVHTTQFAIRTPKYDLLKPVLAITAETIEEEGLSASILKIAGVTGPTTQAVQEAQLAASLGYDIALIGTNQLDGYDEADLLERACSIAEVMPIMGFYLQPAVGGRVLSQSFWQQLAGIENLVGVKIAPFNRYQTLDVIRGICLSSRAEEIALYTGNDDNILMDLLTTYQIKTDRGTCSKRIVGGLLGHWAVWTEKAVALLKQVKEIRESTSSVVPEHFLSEAQMITDSNAAFFDAKHNFAGCIAGLHEVLRRQGLLEGTWCLDPQEGLSPGQREEIDRVYQEYPHLNDDEFVTNFLKKHPL
ncbi:MAG: dihydrodipicolinate synthase family protein [Saprospiraceae bacterium]|nr:dihydrodipicolinate synthase family protein [Saprospiraceae bacterium]